MSNTSIRQKLSSEISGKSLRISTVLIFALGGTALSFIGFALGALLTLTIGFPAPANYGGEAGYEGAATFGGICVAAFTTLILVIVWLRGFTVTARCTILLTYSVLWLMVLLAMHYAVMYAVGGSGFALLSTPAVIIGIVISMMLPNTTNMQQKNSPK